MNLRRNHLLAGAISRVPDWVRTARQAVFALITIGVVGAACPSAWAQQTENYRLAPNDILYFGIFGESDTMAEVRIAGDGTGNFPFLKSVRIGGLTVAQASETLRQAYIQQEYFVNPQVNLGVRAYAKRVFTVLGQVQKPGSYEIVGNESISLLGAVGMAGGYTRIANRGAITVRRNEGGQEQRIRLDGRDGASGASGPDFKIRPGDVVTVGESIF
jgi:protein involved in polysaccharide export with SLBB domain